MNISNDKNGNYVCDLSYKGSYYSQNNNELDPKNTCATTSMIQSLDLLGYEFPQGEYKQHEDNLTYFIRNNADVLEYYKQTDPYNYNNWILNPFSKNVYQPNEIHSVLSYGTNLWMGKDVTHFESNFSINKIPNEILVNNKPLVMSGLFHKLNHVLSCIGVIVNKQSYESKNREDIGFFDCEGFIFNDSYGYTWDYSADRNGEKVLFTKNQIITLLKNKENPTEKWVHLFY